MVWALSRVRWPLPSELLRRLEAAELALPELVATLSALAEVGEGGDPFRTGFGWGGWGGLGGGGFRVGLGGFRVSLGNAR